MIQGKSPGQLVLEMGVCSEMLVVGAVVTEIAVLPTQPGDEASRILRGCSSKPVGVPGFISSISPPHLRPSQLFPLPWEAFVLWQRKPDIRKSIIQSG